MLSRLKTLIFFLGILHYGTPFEFADAGQDGVEFGNLSTSGTQTVTLDESNESGTIFVVELTSVQGEVTLSIINTANSKFFNPQVVVDSGKTYIQTNLVDYEVLDSDKRLLVDITDGAGQAGKLTLLVNLKNLIDENPTITTSRCSMDENLEITAANSECSFVVKDPDGFLADMDFSGIIGQKGESDLFAFEYKETPADNIYIADVYLVLQPGKTLDYEKTNLYTFYLTAKDGGDNPTIPGNISIIVEVGDVGDEPPVWATNFISAKSIQEKTETTMTVSAKDGDYGINNPIEYSIKEDGTSFVSIVKDTGLITISPIDRDAGYNQVTFTVTASEVPDPDSFISGNVTLIIEDIDDNIPEITVEGSDEKIIDIQINETSSDINIEIYANDIDMGDNAIYTAVLNSENEDFLSAFKIIPGRGYEKTSLALTIMDPFKLDYEDETWRKITMELRTEGTKNPTNFDTLPITITLLDLNDEIPQFSKSDYSVSIYENATEGTLVETIQATDKDAEDIAAGLQHRLLGTLATSILKIEELGGDITTIKDDAFDYEKQNEISVQIQATDLFGHSSTAQLTITVLDVNDENPRLTVSTSIGVAENQEDGSVLSTSIVAQDEDSNPDLEFSIDWDSSYATKNSLRLKDDDFAEIQCIKIETEPGGTNNEASAKLSIIETQKNNTPDYEVFDTLYLQLIVTDKNTEKNEGTDRALIVINIQDVNDNAPIFAGNTETARRQVTENAESGTLITSVIATDQDLGTKLNYTIESADDNPNWVKIDIDTGSITVSLPDDEQIDCDDPVRDALTYIVTATDGVFSTSATIKIDILDANDNTPTMGDQKIEIPEDNSLTDVTQDGTDLLVLKPIDGDRDLAFKTVACNIQYGTTIDTNVANRFAISDNTISVSLSNGATLDRESNPDGFEINLNCYDDPGHQGPVSNYISPPPKITITLTDVNDNRPTIANRDITGITENTKGEISTRLQGEDKDEGSNGLINFIKINKITRFYGDTLQNEDTEVPQDLFAVTTDTDSITGILTLTADSLAGYYGYLTLTIELTDLGDVPEPLTNEQDVHLTVSKFNFKPPLFTFPEDGETYYLKSAQTALETLTKWNDEPLESLRATDQQDEKYTITFTIVDDNSDNLFIISNLGGSQGSLQVKTSTFEPNPYQITIMASIEGEPSTGEAAYNTNCTINIQFFDVDTTDPVFKTLEGSTSFKENTTEGSFTLERATYPHIDIDDLDVYYLMREGNDDIFGLDRNKGVITLKEKLDYETTKSYELVIQSSNTDSLKPDALDATRFTLTINVEDINDNPPVFNPKDYVATLSLTDGSKDTTILQLTATDADETNTGKLRYDVTAIVGSNDALDAIPTAFKVDDSGTLISQFDLQSTLEGYFTVTVRVRDEDDGADHQDEATVVVFLVTAKNTVSFKFENELSAVDNATTQIRAILEDQFANYSNTVQKPSTQQASDDGTPRTVQPVFFVDKETKAPAEATVILKRVTDVNLFRTLKSEFRERASLILMSFVSETEATSNLEDTLKAWLIGVSVVLGSLCVILLAAFILKTRALNQRINKLSNTKFGSQESGLNRTGVTVPTTNKHAVEGSNPVYEVETKDVDQRSVTSGDSDLIGVEDDEKFNYYPPRDETFE